MRSEQGGEARAHQQILVAKRAAALALWGETGLARIAAKLPEETRRETIDAPIIAETWIPERWILDWHEAVFRGPAKGDEAALRRFAAEVVQQGFGRVRRVLVKLATPATMASRAAELWRDEHTHGELIARVDKHTAELTLRDHPYVAAPYAGVVMAESMRHAGSLSARAADVTAQHRRDGDGLVISLAWR